MIARAIQTSVKNHSKKVLFLLELAQNHITAIRKEGKMLFLFERITFVT